MDRVETVVVGGSGMQDRFLTAREVAELLQLNVETVYDLIARDELPAIKLGRQWRFQESSLREWLRTRHANAPAQ